MTVAELVAKLLEFDQDAEVLTRYHGDYVEPDPVEMTGTVFLI